MKLIALLLSSLLARWALAGEVSFREAIAPTLQAECLTCHNPEKAKGNYRVDTFERLTKPGDSGQAPIAAGAPERSHLFRLLTTDDEDDRMPQKDSPLTPAQVELFRQWIMEGALFDGDDPGAPISSFVAIHHPPPPEHYRASAPILALAFSKDGQRLFASGYHEVTVWNSADGNLAGRLTNLPARIHSIEMSPDGALLAVAGGLPGRNGEISLFDLRSDDKKQTLLRSSDVSLAVAFTPDGSKLAGGGADNSIRVWELSSGKELHAIQQHADWVTSLAVSPDGKRILSASRDKTVRTYDLATGELQTTFTEHQGPVWAAIYRPGDEHVISAGRDRTIRVWKAEDGGGVHRFDNQPADILGLLATGGILHAALADGSVRQFDLEKKSLLRTLKAGSDYAYSLAAHESLLAVGAHDGGIRIFEGAEERISFQAFPK